MNKDKIEFVEGLKVLCCLSIFNFHFLNIFYPGMYTLLSENYHYAAVEHFIGTTPLNFLFLGGKVGVKMFLLLSGFFVGYRFFLTGDKKSLQNGVIKKYFRLVLPILVINIVIYLLMRFGLYFNDEASVLAKSEILVGNYNTFVPSIFGAIKEAVYGCFVTGKNQYNGPLWFIYYEFFGTLLVAAIISLLGDSKTRYVAYFVAAMLLIRTDFLPIILGTVVCDLKINPPTFIKKCNEQKWLMVFVLLIGLALANFPAIGERMEGTIYQYFPLKIMLYYSISVAMILYSLLQLPGIAKIFAWKPLVKLSSYGYCVYLVHFPILCTLSCALMIVLKDKMNYVLMTVLLYVLSLLIAFGAAIVLHKFVELPGIKFSNKVCKFFKTK